MSPQRITEEVSGRECQHVVVRHFDPSIVSKVTLVQDAFAAAWYKIL